MSDQRVADRATMRAVRVVAAAALATLGGLALPDSAAADIVSPAGACTGTATWATGGQKVVSQQLSPSDVITIPRKDTVSWSVTYVGPVAGTARAVSGRASLKLPPPFGTVAVADWDEQTTDTQQSGTYAYDLPALVPAGVVIGLEASHDEAGKRFCTARVGLVIAGGPFDSPVTWVDLSLLLGSGVGLLLLGRSVGRPGAGRVVGGAFVGAPFGLFGGAALVLFGVVSLASPVVTILPVAGVALGAAWTWWSPLGR